MINSTEYALQEADTIGVQERVQRFRGDVDRGFHAAVIGRWIASVVGSLSLSPAARLAETLFPSR